jgi:hypothetical protein
MTRLYSVRPNQDGRGYDVIRDRPATVAIELTLVEAGSLAHALNAQVGLLEAPPK